MISSNFKKFVLPLIVIATGWILFALATSAVVKGLLFVWSGVITMLFFIYLIANHQDKIEAWFNRDGWK